MMPLQEPQEIQKQKYESSNLQEGEKVKMIKKLLLYMETEEPFKEAELTLSQLADKVKIPINYLSQIINEKMECNFLDFINRYGVEQAKKMLHDNKYEHYTIIAIAYEAGFNSKSAFYTAFKKITNMNPSNFQKPK